MWRVVRCSSRTPRKVSRSFTARVTREGRNERLSAARVKLCISTTRANICIDWSLSTGLLLTKDLLL